MLCHMGGPVGIGGPYGEVGQTPRDRANARARWRDLMSRVASHSNVQLKLSGLAMPICGFGFGERQVPPSAQEVVDAFAPLLEFAIETFGVARCSFASNFPVDKASLTYAQMFDVFEAIVATRPAAERRALFRDNATRFYRIDT
jgi:predicted TIM-barrel fold metal-dependent hydrolase